MDAKNVIIDLRRCNNAFITNIKSASTGVTKRCVCIPVEDNFVEESGYVQQSTGKEIRTAKMQLKMWPVTEEGRQQYGKKNDWELRLDISKSVLEELKQRDAQQAARLSYNDNAYDRELVKQLMPYVGVGYEIKPQQLPPESATTETVDEGDDDLPF